MKPWFIWPSSLSKEKELVNIYKKIKTQKTKTKFYYLTLFPGVWTTEVDTINLPELMKLSDRYDERTLKKKLVRTLKKKLN